MKIIFVDDEENILRGLKRVLHPMRREWEMTFISSGSEAIANMANTKYDAIISDMRMPYMNGVELLNEVKVHHPESLRIVLSGYSESEHILNCVNVAHQYLPKPSDPETIRCCVQNALELNVRLEELGLHKLICGTDRLASSAACVDRVKHELSKASPSLKLIAKLVNSDPALTTKILQIANSAYFGLNCNILSAQEALAYLGLDVFRDLYEKSNIVNPTSHTQTEKIIQHSHTIAQLSKTIAKRANCHPNVVELAYTTGLLSNVGELLLCEDNSSTAGSLISDVKKLENLYSQDIYDLAGRHLLNLWGLPIEICENLHNGFQFQPNKIKTAQHCLNIAIKTQRASDGCRKSWQDLSTHFGDSQFQSWLNLLCTQKDEELLAI